MIQYGDNKKLTATNHHHQMVDKTSDVPWMMDMAELCYLTA